GQTIANSVIAKVGANGQVNIYNDMGTTQVIADVAGWFPTTAAYNALAPARLMDTRPGAATIDGIAAGAGALLNGSVRTVTVTGRGGVPTSGAGTVVLNITVTAPTGYGFLTAFPTGSAIPATSNLNFGPGQTIGNQVIAQVGTNGQVSIYNPIGSTQVIADVAGWFPTGTAYNALPAARLMDTRPGAPTTDGIASGTGPLAPGATRTLTVTGRGGVPATGVGAVVINMAVTGTTAPSFLTVFPTGWPQPNASSLNFGAGQTIANLVIAKVGSNGQISITNFSGSTQVIGDVAGWFA
ncbi:MAG: hypothetical protein ABIS47_05265, partial [Acidimicrobiales bacterium]